MWSGSIEAGPTDSDNDASRPGFHNSLDDDHPAWAYLDDAKALVDLINDDPSILEKNELSFLRKISAVTSSDGSAIYSSTHSQTELDDDERTSKSLDQETADEGFADSEEWDEEGYWEDDDCNDTFVWRSNNQQDLPFLAGADTNSDKTHCETNNSDDQRDVGEHDGEVYECVIIGAGAAGVGVSIALLAGGMKRCNLLVVDSKTVGSSFDSWPPHTHFISPSMYSNPFGPVDLNAVDPWSSPAKELTIDPIIGKISRNLPKQCTSVVDNQHPTGRQYAEYLRRNASRWSIPIRQHTKVVSVIRVKGTSDWPTGGFEVKVERCRAESNTKLDDEPETTTQFEALALYSRFVVWCGGEWTYPHIPSQIRDQSLSSSTLYDKPFLHYSEIGPSSDQWQLYVQQCGGAEGKAVVVGGFEAGVDAACTLIELGIGHVVVVESERHIQGWEGILRSKDSLQSLSVGGVDAFKKIDPSTTLSMSSICRLRDASKIGAIELMTNRRCIAVTMSPGDGRLGYIVHVERVDDGSKDQVPATGPILLCTGFTPRQCCILDGLVDWGKSSKGGSIAQAFAKDFNTGGPVVSQSCDESLKTPGFFICGPSLRHVSMQSVNDLQCNSSISCLGPPSQLGKQKQPTLIMTDSPSTRKIDTVIFCFIYKFRTRFSLVAGEILSRLIY
ncbi:MAG: NAD(P)-binding domain-containing protein, partial [bacterium]